MMIAIKVLVTLAAILCASGKAASEAPQTTSIHDDGPSASLEIRGVDQESTFGCRLNVPISAAQFEVLNQTSETRTVRILEIQRLRARCPDDQPSCTVGDLWDRATPQRADPSPEPILWLSLTHEEDDDPSPHPVNELVAVPPGVVLLTIGIQPWFPGHIPHWLRGTFRVGGEDVHSVAEASGREIFCLPEELPGEPQ